MGIADAVSGQTRRYGARQLCWIEMNQVAPSAGDTSNQYEERTPKTNTKIHSYAQKYVWSSVNSNIVKTNQYINV